MNKKKPLFFLGFLFFLSGFSGLVLQVIWTRRIAIVFGSTIVSASITIAAFMFGLGLGAYLAGKNLHRWKRLIYLYSVLELLIGISAFIVTLLIPSFTPISVFIANSLFNITFLQVTFKFLVVFITLLIPCTAMGATLPVLTQAFTEKDENFGKVISILYAINTGGAAMGAFLSDFVLVELTGVIQTAFFAGTINILVALSAFLYGRNIQTKSASILSKKVKIEKLLYLVFAFTGFCSIAYEIVWIRMLVFFDGCDVFAFSSMLTTFLIGIVIGSFLISIFINKIRDKEFTLGIMLLITGIVAFLINILSIEMVLPVRNYFTHLFNLSFPLDRFLTNFILMLPCTILFGAIFPLNSKILQEKIRNPGETVGEAYLWNTFGSIGGSLCAGFLMIPLLGIQGSIAFLSSLIVIFGGIYIVFTGKRTKRLKLILSLIVIASIIGVFMVPRDMVLKGIYYLYEDEYDNIISQREDKYSSIALIKEWDKYEHDYVINLITDGYNMASNNFVSRRYAMSLSLVPSLLHENPEDVLVICLGLTNTLNAARSLNITRQVDCVELSAAIVDMIHQLELPEKTVNSPKVKIIINDGRNYLLTSNKKYDIITAEPPPPINAGIVNLYSKEYYELCKNSLKPGGYVTQWLPLRQMSSFEARTIIRAFLDVFPYTYLWGWGDLNFCLLGSMEEITVDYPRLKKRISENRELLASLGLEKAEIFTGAFLKGPDSLLDYCSGTPPLTDNRPYIQYSRGNWVPDTDYFFQDTENQIKIYKGDDEIEILENDRDLEKGSFAIFLLRQYEKMNSRSVYLDVFNRSLLANDLMNLYPGNDYFLFATKANEKVRKFYSEKLEKDPSNPAYYFELARIDSLNGKFENSLENIDFAIDKAHENNRPFYEIYRALILEYSKDKEEAIGQYKNVMGKTDKKDLIIFIGTRLKELGE